MSDSFRTEIIETDAGPYHVELFPDYDAPNPLTDWGHEGMAFYLVGGDDLDLLDNAEHGAANALRTWIKAGYRMEEIAQRYRLWKAMFGGTWNLAHGTGWGYSQESWTWYVLADSEWRDPVEAANNTMDTYQYWVQGGFCGYVVTSPNGGRIDSCWSFESDDAALEQAQEFIEMDSAQRLGQANLVGAGFVSII